MSNAALDPTTGSLLERVCLPGHPGHRASWAAFVELYAPLVLLWVGRLGVPSADRADVVQDVFVTLTTELRTFRPNPSRRFRGFLFAVTRSRAMDHHRAARRSDGPVPEVAVPDTLQAVFDADYSRHMMRHIDRVLDAHCDPRDARAFRRYVVEEASPQTVAAELGIPVGSVYQIKSRVMRVLRAELDGLLD